MKDNFPEFGYKPDLDKLWNNCDFVFDTNVFIDLYYQKKQSKEFLGLLENKIPDRIWMPYQIGLEYHRNRIDAIKDLEIKYNFLINTVKGYKKSVKTSIKNLSKSHLVDIENYVDMGALEKNLDDIDKIISEELILNIEENVDFYDDDNIRNKLSDLYLKRIGENYSESELFQFYEEAELRTKYKIPPSFEDKGHGDLILWKQILDYAKKESKDIIFVTSDLKKDWWLITKSKKRVSPHPSLIKEFLATGNDFYMYKFSDFLKKSGRYLDTSIDDEVIQNAEEIEHIRESADEINDYEDENNSDVATVISRLRRIEAQNRLKPRPTMMEMIASREEFQLGLKKMKKSLNEDNEDESSNEAELIDDKHNENKNNADKTT